MLVDVCYKPHVTNTVCQRVANRRVKRSETRRILVVDRASGCTLHDLRNWPYRPVRTVRVSIGRSWPVNKRRVWGVFQVSVICPKPLFRTRPSRIRMSCVRLNGFFSANYRALCSQSGCLLPRRLLPNHRTERFTFGLG